MSLPAGKKFILDRVEEFKIAHPKVRWENVNKIEKAVAKASNSTMLGFALTNFILAHPSEGLKVMK